MLPRPEVSARASVSRRSVLTSLGVGGISLWAGPFGDSRLLADATTLASSAKSIIFLALYGGPPHQDTWDIKEDAPVEMRGEFSSIATSLDGFRVCEYMPKLATLAHLYTVIRSVTHKDIGHESAFYSLMTGWPHPQPNTIARPTPDDYPGFGTMLDSLQQTDLAVPGFILTGGRISKGIGQTAGFLGSSHEPFVLKKDASDAEFCVPELTLHDDVGLPRLARRRGLLSQLDSHLGPETGMYSSIRTRALEMLGTSKLRDAFDINSESPRVRAAYGADPFCQNLLLARRLVEAGVPIVQVNWRNRGDGGLDTHYDNFNHCKWNILPKIDACLSSLLIDLEQRGLLDQTLVVAAGEFGRTPTINPDAGRDHWAGCNSILLAGAGITRGYVHGSSQRDGAYPATDPVGPWDIHATMLHCWGIDPTTTLYDAQNRPHRISMGQPISAVLQRSPTESRPKDNQPLPSVAGTSPQQADIPRVYGIRRNYRTKTNRLDGGMLAFIPGGEFVMGSDEFSIERPPHRVQVRPFWIGQTPVTNAMFQRFRNETGHRATEYINMHLVDATLYAGDDQPVIGVDHSDAEAYAHWAGGRLPSEAEWEFAARGTDGRRYPWGNEEPRPGRAVYGLTLGKGGKSTPVGTTPGDTSPFGVLDMAGNVLEWCADWFAMYPRDRPVPLDNPQGPPQGKQRIMRGGCWAYAAPALRAAARTLSPPKQRLNLAGFRIVIDVTPDEIS